MILIFGFRNAGKLSVIPGPLLAVVLSTVIVWWQELDKVNVAIVGYVPKGLPPLSDIDFSYCSHYPRIFTTSLLVSLIGFIEGTFMNPLHLIN